jgi:hypothetical protein
MKELTKKTGHSERVLARRGARELTVREADAVSGGGSTIICTDVASLAYSTVTHTGCPDNDGGHDTDTTF